MEFFSGKDVGEYVANFFVGSHNPGKVFVFNWTSTIAASPIASEYYADLLFELMEIPPTQPNKKLGKLSMLAQDYSVTPLFHLANFAKFL